MTRNPQAACLQGYATPETRPTHSPHTHRGYATPVVRRLLGDRGAMLRHNISKEKGGKSLSHSRSDFDFSSTSLEGIGSGDYGSSYQDKQKVAFYETGGESLDEMPTLTDESARTIETTRSESEPPASTLDTRARPPAGLDSPARPPAGLDSPARPPPGLDSPARPSPGLDSPAQPPAGLSLGSPAQPPTGLSSPAQPPTGLSSPAQPPSGLGSPAQPPADLGSPAQPPAGLGSPAQPPAGLETPPQPPPAPPLPTP